VLQAEGALTQTASAEAKAHADADREHDLFEHDAVAQKEVLNADAVLAQAKAAVEQARAARDQARRRLDILGIQAGQFGQRIAVKAPLSGKVLELTVAPGEFRSDTAAALMTIADLSTVWVTADVPETSIGQIRVGNRLDVELAAFPGKTFHAPVTQIADTVDPQSRTVKVRTQLDNRDGLLRPEMFGQVRNLQSVEMQPVIPAAAVMLDQGKQVVWRRTAPGVFERVVVQTGTRTGEQVAVFHGLKTGDEIVTDGLMLLNAD
jgi:cobalt-zinc-cadmium efflux system membrane fusion protein